MASTVIVTGVAHASCQRPTRPAVPDSGAYRRHRAQAGPIRP